MERLGSKLCQPEDTILKKGDASDGMYFIIEGNVDIYVEDPSLGKRPGYYFQA